jgi:hypothetical protein
MDSNLKNKTGKTAQDTDSKVMDRRNFARKILAAGFLSSAVLLGRTKQAQAWMDGTFSQRQDLPDAIRALKKTYSDVDPYPHKFNDALVKNRLRDIDFVTSKGLEKENVDHFVYTLGYLINKYLRDGVEMGGKDVALWGMFERTSCSYQLYEHIYIKEFERSFTCPFKPMLEELKKDPGTFKIKWKDVCNKWCIPVWNGFAERAAVEIKVKTGETCKVKVL